jgi:dihydroflavonol-4-reductase
MKALVIGAGGHLGNAITRALLDRGWEVSACGRRPLPLNLEGLPVRYLRGDADNPRCLDEWTAGHDLIVDAAAPYPMSLIFPGRPPEADPFAAAEARTRHLIDAALKHDAILAYVGSFVTQVSPSTDAQRARAGLIKLTLPYFQVKQLIEAQLLDAAPGGLRSVIVNPTYCLGPWDLHDRRVCTIPLLLCGEIPGRISQMLNVIDVRDVAAALLLAIEARRYSEPLLTTAHAVSTEELYALVCRMGGVPMPRLSSSTNFAMFTSYLTELLYSAMGQQTPIISAGMMMATAIDYLDRPSALSETGIAPRPLAETIRDAITWYRAIGYC